MLPGLGRRVRSWTGFYSNSSSVFAFSFFESVKRIRRWLPAEPIRSANETMRATFTRWPLALWSRP